MSIDPLISSSSSSRADLGIAERVDMIDPNATRTLLASITSGAALSKMELDSDLPLRVSSNQKGKSFDEEIARIGQISEPDEMRALLAKMDERGISLFDQIDAGIYFSKLAASATPSPLCVLLSAAILTDEKMPPHLAAEIKNHLLSAPFDDMLLATLLKGPAANQIFDSLFHFLDQDDINGNDALKELVLNFASKQKRYDYLFFQSADCARMKLELDFYLTQNQSDPRLLQELFQNREWMTRRAHASSTLTLNAIPQSWPAVNHFLFDPKKLQEPFSLSMLQEAHGIMMAEELAPKSASDVEIRGRFRNDPTILKSHYKGIVRTGTWKELYCLPQLLGTNLQHFERWMNDSIRACNEGKMNPIVLAGLAHQRLLSLHPFMNGNGRMSRLLMDWILLKYNLPPPVMKVEMNGGLEPVFPLMPKQGNPERMFRVIFNGIDASKQFMRNQL